MHVDLCYPTLMVYVISNRPICFCLFICLFFLLYFLGECHKTIVGTMLRCRRCRKCIIDSTSFSAVGQVCWLLQSKFASCENSFFPPLPRKLQHNFACEELLTVFDMVTIISEAAVNHPKCPKKMYASGFSNKRIHISTCLLSAHIKPLKICRNNVIMKVMLL